METTHIVAHHGSHMDVQGKLRNAPPLVRQLAGENAWLKEQLDSAMYRYGREEENID